MITNIDGLRSAIRTGTLMPGGIPFVTPFRSTEERVRMPQTSDLYLYVVLDGVLRLYTPSGIMDYVMEQGVPSEFMRKNAVQEIIYNVLCGSSGRQLVQSIASIHRADEIYQANSWIKENFRGSFSVEELAEQQNMSVSLFHQRFKSAVGMGPLQCHGCA